MIARHSAALAASLIAGVLLLVAPGAAVAADRNAADTARLLAGMPLDAASPLAPMTESGSWQRHAKRFDAAWDKFETRQLKRIRTWSDAHIPQRKPVVYYMFSGPDYLYANAFFPDASTYILSGLEPVGPIPDVAGLSQGALASELAQLQQSLNSVLSFSFFITKKMKTQLKAGRIRGTLPVLYVFLARAGKTIQDVKLIALDEEGTVHPDADLPKGRARGVKIVFAGEGGKEQTLYYFSTDVSNGAIERSGFLKFCEGHGRGDALLKSASYLMHSGGFTTVRDFVLARSDAIVQDDSGIPLRNFEREDWEFYAFGNYLGPISIFPGRYQRDLRALFARQKTDKLDFSIGYRWRPNQSNLLLARRADHVSKTD